MAEKSLIETPVILAVLIATAAVGCGGGGSSSSSEGSTAEPSQTTTSETTPSEDSNSEPSAEFVGKGPNGKLATVGEEADPAEREAASRVLKESLQAREARDWAGQCSTLAAEAVKQIEKSAVVLNAARGCAKVLEAQAAQVSKSALENTMIGPIDAFRVVGNRGIAFYHGTKSKDYVIPMIKEGDEWKVASLVTQEAP